MTGPRLAVAFARPLLAFATALGAITLAASQPPSVARLTLTEGTSMAAALSPDGRTIAIDLLGALWTLPSSGGPAARILEDGYDARLPAWSPDGRRLAFQGYRASTWNIWTVAADGSALRQETSGPFDDREPHWSPDGARLAFSSDRSGSYDIWLLTLKTGDLHQLTTNTANDFMPAWAADGRTIAFVSDRGGRRGVYAIDADSGAEQPLIDDAPGAAAAASGAGGKMVAFTAVDGAVTRLMIGAANIADPDEDVFPFRPQWISADEVLYTADGHIKRRPIAGRTARTIAFSAEVMVPRASFTPKRRAWSDTSAHPVRGLIHPAVSPDASRVAFGALGDLWLAPTSGGDVPPERITSDVFVDIYPAWSPDGQRLAFCTDRDGTMDLWVRDLRTGVDRKLASGALAPAWSPDASQIAFLTPGAELHVVDVASGQTRKVHDRLSEPGRPSWSPDGRAVVMSALRPYSTRFREGVNQVLHVPVGSESADRWLTPLPHKSIGMREASGPVWSPDGAQMAAIVDGHLTVFPVNGDGTPAGPPRQLSGELANTPSWTADSRHLLYQSAGGFRLVDAITGETRRIAPRLSWTARIEKGHRVVHAGRLFDGTGAAARENVDIVIAGDRITRVEAHRDDLHTGEVVDGSNATVLPGLIESHTHLTKASGEALGRIWLAFGITTVRNPAANAFEAVEDREAYDSGARIGPRVFTTGEPFDGTRTYYPGGAALDGGVELSERLALAEAMGFDFVKTYVRLPDLLQQRVIAEAHRMGMPVTSHEIYPAVAYGADGVEHIRGTSRRGFSPKMSERRRSYRDVIDLLATSRMTITPTIGLQGGFDLLAQRDPAWLGDPRLQQLFPPAVVPAARARVAPMSNPAALAAQESLVAPQERMAAEVVKRGGRVIAGTDSPILPYGLTLLMELDHLVRGGLSPADAIRAATAVPAGAMGAGADLGTVEAGKLADLLIVDGNPLERIGDIRRMRTVLKGGVVYQRDALVRRPARAAK